MTPGKNSKCRLPPTKQRATTPINIPCISSQKHGNDDSRNGKCIHTNWGKGKKKEMITTRAHSIGKKWGSRERNFNFGFSCMELPLPSVSLRSFGEWVRKSPIDPLLFGHVRGLHGFYLQYPFFVGVILGVGVKFRDILAIWRMISINFRNCLLFIGG